MTSLPRTRLLGGVALALAALATAAAAPAQAKPGHLDLTFGKGGTIGVVGGIQGGMARGPDGVIHLSANYQEFNAYPFQSRVGQVQPDGSSPTGGGESPLFLHSAIAALPNGKTVIVGISAGQFAVARFGADGTLDDHFDADPAVAFSSDGIYLSATGQARSVAVEPDGDLIVAGADQDSVRVERIGPDGTNTGTYEEDLGPDDTIAEIARLPSGSMIAVTEGSVGGPYAMRMTESLTPDPAFSTPGLGIVKPESIAIQPDGRILVGGGGSDLSPSNETILRRLEPDGDLDPTFPGVVEDERLRDARGLAVDPAGRIVAVGGIGLARLLPDGSFDPSFATDRTVGGFAVELQDDGKIIVGHEIASPAMGQPGVGPTPGAVGVSRYLGAEVRCGGLDATYVGSPAGETIQADKGRDVIAGMGGEDRIFGLQGKDVACGGVGDDRLFGGAGDDRLLGGKGRDVLRGGKGTDVLRGGKGRDRERQ